MTTTPRQIALEILNTIEKKGAHADQLLGAGFNTHPSLTAREKAFITELVYGVLRWQGTLDWIIQLFSASPQRPISRLLRNLLRLGIYQALYLTQVPVPVSVFETVELAKALLNKKMAQLLNAVLRNVTRNRDALPYPSLTEDPINAIAIRYSHPVWLVKKWINHYGVETTRSLCQANNVPPRLVIRTNTLKTTRIELMARLQEEGLAGEATPYSSEGIIIHHPADITRLASFRKGWFFVQDEAAQLISHLVLPEAGDCVLELCAAPGGKTTHLAQLMGDQGDLVALDIRPESTRLLKENQCRLEIHMITPLVADATRPLPFHAQQRFDKVLLDVPCSGLGTLRRHPEGKWSKTEATITKLKKTQTNILCNAASYVKPSGIMVYATCTLSAEENEQAVEAFLSHDGKDFVVDDPLSVLPPGCAPLITERGYLQTLPHRDAMDGFFGVRLRKTK